MKTYIVAVALLLTIGASFLFSDESKAQNKTDLVVASAAAGKAAPAKTAAKKLPSLYILVTNNCGPCERLKQEIFDRGDRARWLIENHKLLLVKVDGFPAIMASNGSQFEWPAECWKRDGSPLKALTDYLGFKEKESKKVGINDLARMNAELVLSDFSGVSQPVTCIAPDGTEYPVQGDFLEDEANPLQVDGNSETQSRTALVDLPVDIEGSPAFARKWTFRVNSETWQFNGFKGRDVNVQTVMLKIPGQEKYTGHGARY